ncbi:MAG: hypothetical protein V1733_11850 [bacterium]
MKRQIQNFIILTALLGVAISSCTKDDPNPSPADPRLAFVGNWSVNETEQRLTYEANIESDPYSLNGGVYIYNFANAGSSSNPAYAYVSGNTITLEVNQVIGDGWIINGSGIKSGNTINWPYTLNDGANLHNINAVFTKN